MTKQMILDMGDRMRDIPMIFKGWGVRAICAGRKTVTRRLKFRGKPGDKIWCKETWAVGEQFDPLRPSELMDIVSVWYLANGSKPTYYGKTRVSLFMPKRFSRIRLNVLDVKEVSLQSITEADVIKEGLLYNDPYWLGGTHPKKGTWKCWPTAIDAYAAEWDDINGHKPGCTFADNATVQRIEFEIVQP